MCAGGGEVFVHSVCSPGSCWTLHAGAAVEGATPAVEMASERFVGLTGFAAAELGGAAGWHGLLGPDTAPEVVAKADAAIAAAATGGWPLLLYRKDGTCRW